MVRLWAPRMQFSPSKTVSNTYTIYKTLDDVMSLSHTFCDEFNGDLNGAIQSKNGTQVETLTTLTKMCNAVAVIQKGREESQEFPQLDEIYERLSQMKQKLDLQQAPHQLERQHENYLQNLGPTPTALHPFTREEEDGMMDLTQSSGDKDSETIVAANRMPAPIDFFLPDFDTICKLQKKAATLGSAMEADRPYEKNS